jgi:hypothetical protein
MLWHLINFDTFPFPGIIYDNKFDTTTIIVASVTVTLIILLFLGIGIGVKMYLDKVIN